MPVYTKVLIPPTVVVGAGADTNLFVVPAGHTYVLRDIRGRAIGAGAPGLAGALRYQKSGGPPHTSIGDIVAPSPPQLAWDVQGRIAVAETDTFGVNVLAGWTITIFATGYDLVG